MPSLEPAPKQRALLWSWSAALLISALLVGAGHRWPTPLLEQDWARQHPQAPLLLVLLLLLVPPLSLAVWLLRGLPPPPAADPDRGESSDCVHGER